MGKELAPKPHVQVKFCSDPVRSEDYFPEWKPALIGIWNPLEGIRTISKNPESTSRNPESTSRNPESTSRSPESTSRNLKSTKRNLESTSRNPESTGRNPEWNSLNFLYIRVIPSQEHEMPAPHLFKIYQKIYAVALAD